MNKNFVNAVKNSGITPYRLSKYSGVPYTIISELLTGKKDINKRAADTVLRLAKALNLEISDIMNPVMKLLSFGFFIIISFAAITDCLKKITF